MRTERFTLTLLAALALSLAGCATQQAGTGLPERAGASVPAQWEQQTAGHATLAGTLALDEAWWTAFNDAQLDALIQRVLTENLSLSAAALKVSQARLRADLADADRWPTVAASLNSQGARPLEGGSTTRSSSATLSATWELDFWGRVSALRDVQVWEAKATEDDRRALALSLVGTTARLYWQMAYLDQRVQSAQQSLDYARKTQALVEAQYKAGSVGGLEQAQAQQAVSAQVAAQAALVQTREETRQTLALLLDGPTQSARLPAQYTWPATPWPLVRAGVPAEVLARRPDVRAAEYRMREAHAGVKATRTAYYPRLTLTGAVGGSSQDLTDVLRDPVGTVAGSLLLPFVQFREMERNTAIAQADADAAVLGFRQTLYQALSDVDKGLSAQVQAERQTRALQSRLEQALKVERLTELRYRAGAEPLRSWLDAQEARRTAELALADARYSQLSSYVSLVQALGGHVPLADVPAATGALAQSRP